MLNVWVGKSNLKVGSILGAECRQQLADPAVRADTTPVFAAYVIKQALFGHVPSWQA